MRSELEPDNFHDGILQRLTVDIENKQTQLVLKEWSYPDDDHYTISELTFEGVAWQNFKDFNEFNCLFTIEVSESFAEFAQYEKDYLEKMKNYFSVGTLEAIESDTTLRYYYLNASHGLDGFIICKNLSVIANQFTQTLED